MVFKVRGGSLIRFSCGWNAPASGWCQDVWQRCENPACRHQLPLCRGYFTTLDRCPSVAGLPHKGERSPRCVYKLTQMYTHAHTCSAVGLCLVFMGSCAIKLPLSVMCVPLAATQMKEREGGLGMINGAMKRRGSSVSSAFVHG